MTTYIDHDYPAIRACHICPRCLAVKNQELVLCWPCHNTETRSNGGMYSDSMIEKLEDFEQFLLNHGAMQ